MLEVPRSTERRTHEDSPVLHNRRLETNQTTF